MFCADIAFWNFSFDIFWLSITVKVASVESMDKIYQ